LAQEQLDDLAGAVRQERLFGMSMPPGRKYGAVDSLICRMT